MATLKFAAPAVLELLHHAIAAPTHTSPYSKEDRGPGLFLVKDEGVYLMSNGKPGLPGSPRPGSLSVSFHQALSTWAPMGPGKDIRPPSTKVAVDLI
jgi:hypothetical protein